MELSQDNFSTCINDLQKPNKDIYKYIKKRGKLFAQQKKREKSNPFYNII